MNQKEEMATPRSSCWCHRTRWSSTGTKGCRSRADPYKASKHMTLVGLSKQTIRDGSGTTQLIKKKLDKMKKGERGNAAGTQVLVSKSVHTPVARASGGAAGKAHKSKCETLKEEEKRREKRKRRPHRGVLRGVCLGAGSAANARRSPAKGGWLRARRLRCTRRA